MPVSVLVAVPLLVLAVVLLLGFTGCQFVHGASSPPTTSLTFIATVPPELTVVAPGITFAWDAPVGVPGTATVPEPPPSVDVYITSALGLGPSLFWTLGSANGLMDRSGTGNDGTPLGGVTVGGDPDGPTDFPDATATLFDGVDDGIGSSYNPFVGTAARTFVGWARWVAGGPAEYTLFGSSAGDNNRPNLRLVTASRDVTWLPSGDDGQVITWPAAAPPQDTWFMWALRSDLGTGNAALFIDGMPVSQQTLTEPWPASPGTFQAAVGAATRHPFKGEQGLVAVYEKFLADDQIAQLYQASHEDSVYPYQFPSADLGTWAATCAMTVQADGQTQQASSHVLGTIFTLDDPSLNYTVTFRAEGSPSDGTFTVQDGEFNHD